MASKPKKWIKAATEKKGALHAHLGVPAGEKIPEAKLTKAAHSSNPTIRKEAALAETLKGFHHGSAKGRQAKMYGAK